MIHTLCLFHYEGLPGLHSLRRLSMMAFRCSGEYEAHVFGSTLVVVVVVVFAESGRNEWLLEVGAFERIFRTFIAFRNSGGIFAPSRVRTESSIEVASYPWW